MPDGHFGMAWGDGACGGLDRPGKAQYYPDPMLMRAPAIIVFATDERGPPSRVHLLCR
jgi:hypothetical protein